MLSYAKKGWWKFQVGTVFTVISFRATQKIKQNRYCQKLVFYGDDSLSYYFEKCKQKIIDRYTNPNFQNCYWVNCKLMKHQGTR